MRRDRKLPETTHVLLWNGATWSCKAAHGVLLPCWAGGACLGKIASAPCAWIGSWPSAGAMVVRTLATCSGGRGLGLGATSVACTRCTKCGGLAGRAGSRWLTGKRRCTAIGCVTGYTCIASGRWVRLRCLCVCVPSLSDAGVAVGGVAGFFSYAH